ncbi:MAG: carbon-nitrogen hydrolase family protein [Desulfuromusa sp.]|nr:carbon-nitrogen hydrolase family protein [Desulfuromusa sp.]
MNNFAIAGIQLDAVNGDNLDHMTKQIDQVMKRYPWVQLIMFGELCVSGTSINSAQPMPGSIENHFCSVAKNHNIWLIPGSMYEIADDKIYNTAPVINPEGEVVTRHRKLYPFDPYEKGVAGGQQHTVFDIPDVGRFGVSICYDMWFPETVRALAYLGAEVILHPTLTGTLDRDLELSIARSSAITNQCYFVDINSSGSLGNGKSIVVGPEGEIIHQSDRSEENIPVYLDLDRVEFTRENGVLGLGQPLKSFRDYKLGFPQYKLGATSESFDRLGSLIKPNRIR